MHNTIALIFRHFLSFRPWPGLRLPDNTKQILAADLARALSEPGEYWCFEVPPGLGLTASLRDLFELYSGIRFFYTGKNTKLYIKGQSLPRSRVPWLDIAPAKTSQQARSINGNGTLTGFLPDLPPGRCSKHLQNEYYLTPELLTWFIDQLWNFKNLREGQFEIISRLARRQNTLGILPTGAGKSLCFQVPAMLLPGITLVVSPLKSLMRDQFVSLSKSGLCGMDFIDSSKTPEEKEQVLAALRTGQLKLLYLSPERLQIESFQRELAETMNTYPVSLFTIDEAHCISEWGHDFRPSYLRLRHFIAQLRHPPICALTATASRYVRQDILSLLGLNHQDTVTPKTMDRKEISLQVKMLEHDDLPGEIAKTIKTEIPNILGREYDSIQQVGAGVVFTPYAAPRGRYTRPLGAESVARKLQELGLDCKCYHGKLRDADRTEIQDQFKDNAFSLLVATKGYGMGIDKDNIDFIVHACAPASLEAYYQEAGRAGRDGEHAHSVIITRLRQAKCIGDTKTALPPCHQGWQCQYNGGEKCDFGIQAGLLATEYPPEQETAQRFTRFLQQLAEYANNGTDFRYVCPARDSARQQKYLYHLQVLGAVLEFKVLEYRKVEDNQFDLLLYVQLAGPDSLANQYWLANKVVERIETYKAQKLNMLNTVQLYINTKACRRRFLMQYFGDDVRYNRCNFCDIDGISALAAPSPDKARGFRQIVEHQEAALAQKDLALAIRIAEQARILEMTDDVTVRAMRELEDRPDNIAALFLAGIFSSLDPETSAYGIRNLAGAVEMALEEEEQVLDIFSQLAQGAPDAAYALACRFLDRMDTTVLKGLAGLFEQPDTYPDIHLALLLNYVKQINQLIEKEVPDGDQ